MQTPVMTAGPTTGPSTSATRYSSIASGGAWTSTEATVRSPFGAAGTVSNFRVRCGTAISAGSYAFTLRKGAANGGVMSDQTTTVTCDSGSQEAVDSAHSFSVSETDEVTLKCVPASTPTAQTVIQWSFVFTSTTTGESTVFAGHSSTGSAGYFALGVVGNGVSATESNSVAGPMPTGGTFKNLIIQLGTAPGVGNSRTYTLRKGGVGDTALTVTLSDAEVAKSVTADVSYAAGDTIDIAVTIVGTPAASSANCGLKWVPTTDGESLLPSTWAGNVSNSSTVYTSAPGKASTSETTESNAYSLAPVAFDWKKMYVIMSAAAGAAKSRVFTARKGDASQSLAVDLNGASAVTGNDTANTVSVAAGDRIDVMQVPTGTPASATAFVMSVAYIAPAGGGNPLAGLGLLLGVGS